MIIEKAIAREVGSCNYCDRGILNESQNGLIYPYEYVYLIKGKYLAPRMCESCLIELHNFLNEKREKIRGKLL